MLTGGILDLMRLNFLFFQIAIVVGDGAVVCSVKHALQAFALLGVAPPQSGISLFAPSV